MMTSPIILKQTNGKRNCTKEFSSVREFLSYTALASFVIFVEGYGISWHQMH
jgi:hypothetical protein